MLDYPGEWLLDLPMLSQDYAGWSAATLAMPGLQSTGVVPATNRRSLMTNTVLLVGNLGADPETRSTRGDTKITSFSLGTSRPKLEKSPDGNVGVRGGQLQAAQQPGLAAAPVREPKISDRPVNLPGAKKSAPQ